MLCIDKTGYALPVIITAALHEGAHIFAMWICDKRPGEIHFIPGGVLISGEPSCVFEPSLFVILSGPFFNIAVSLAAFLRFNLSGSESALVFAFLNLFTGVFNLLPFSGLDGGSALYVILSKRCLPDKAQKTVRNITLVSSQAVFAAGVFLALQNKINVSVFTAAVYLFICAVGCRM